MNAWTHIQGTGGASSGVSGSISATIGATAGGFLVVGMADLNVSGFGVDTFTIHDGSNVYTPALQVVFNLGGVYQYINIWYLVGVAGGSLTVTCTPLHSGYLNISIDEYSLAGSFQSVESTNSATGTSASASSGNCTISGTDLLYSVATQATNTGANPFSAGASFNSRYNNVFATGSAVGFMAEDQLNVTSGPVAATFGLAASATWVAGAVAFKAVPGGAAALMSSM